jgi:predicted dinucleotide-binding enzyme
VEAKQQVGGLIDQIGFCSIDLGSLATGGRPDGGGFAVAYLFDHP